MKLIPAMITVLFCLSSLHVSQAFGETVNESARNIPVAYDVDIVVVGGSSAGVAAAVEAAQQGASVFLAAPRPYLGEDLCATYRLWLEPNEEPNSSLAMDIFTEAMDGITFTYEADEPSAGGHMDTEPPSLLTDGLYFSTFYQSVQYNSNVNIIADMSEEHSLRKVHVLTYQRDNSFEVESVTVSISNDKQQWEEVAVIINEELGEGPVEHSSIDLWAPVMEEARYVKFFIKKGPNANRVLLGEIVIEKIEQYETRIPPSPMQVKRTLDQALLAADVQFLFGCYATDVLHDADGNLAGIVMANRSGRQAVKAKVIIDATPRALVARMAGAAFQPYPAGMQSFKRIVVGGEVQTGEGIQARIMPTPIPCQGNRYDAIEYTLNISMEDSSFASFAEAEQVARDKTWHPEQVDASEVLFQVPPDPIYGSNSLSGDWPGAENIDLDVFRPADANQLYVLGGCADMQRAAAEKLLRPLNFLEVGKRIGEVAAADANSLSESVEVRLTGPGGTGTVAGDVRELLAGARPMQVCLPTIPSDERTLPVLGEYDVVVVGGGTSGAPAGIGAAREGEEEKTLVIEYLHGLGGVGTLGLIGSYCGCGDRWGFTLEIDDGVTGMGGKIGDVDWNVECKMEWYRNALRDEEGEGADIWFGTLGCGAFVKNGTVKGVVVATPQGRGVVLAKVVIDSTGNSDIAISAGADYMFTGSEDAALQGTGLPPRGLGDYYNNTDYTFLDDSDMVDIWRASVIGRKRYKSSYDMGQLIDTRERCRIVGDFVISPLDICNNRTYPDTVVMSCSFFDSHGFTVHPFWMFKDRRNYVGCYSYTPYRSLLPKNLDGILVTGLGMSAHRDSMPVLRMQPDLQNQGYAAGVAAALSVNDGVSPRGIDIKVLQNVLVMIGNVPASVLTDEDSFPLSEERIAQAVNDVVNDFNGIEVILAQPEDALPLLRDAYETAGYQDKLTYAEILGIMGDAIGSITLIEAVQGQQWDLGWNFQPGGGTFGNSLSPLDVLIIALGYTRHSEALGPIVEKVEQLSPASEFSHHRAVAIALEALGDPAAAEPLANLLGKPGMTGYAFTEIDAPPFEVGGHIKRGHALRELILARALYRCGDYNGMAKSILNQYEGDFRGHYARHAHAVLKEKCPDFNDDCMIDIRDLATMAGKWLDSSDGIVGDLDRDGRVDFEDFGILAKMWLEEQLWPSSYLP